MSRRRFPGFASSAAFAVSLLMASKGFAQGNANQAEALFHEGRAALDRGDLAVACGSLKMRRTAFLLLSAILAFVTGCGALFGVDFEDKGTRPAGDSSSQGGDGGGGSLPSIPPVDGKCAVERKLCSDLCVDVADPAFGCGPSTCNACATAGEVCSAGVCAPPCKGSECTAEATTLSLGYLQATCAVRSGDGSLVCWGSGQLGQVTTPPAGVFRQLSANNNYTCGVRGDGSLACWGYDGVHGRATPPAGVFAQVSAGGAHACGVRGDGSLACWGDNRQGQATPPAGAFRQVSAGEEHTCGVRSDGSLACWGDNAFDQALPPAGVFRQVSAGEYHTCGVRSDGSVACWGVDLSRQATPPAGAFRQVSAAGDVFDTGFGHTDPSDGHTCGVRRDGSVACWGGNRFGQATPPAGVFRQVSAGKNYTCGVRGDGSVACWGDDRAGQATPPAGLIVQ